MKRTIMLAALFAAGCAAALTLGATMASAHTPDQLPGLGYSVDQINLGNGCHQWKAAYGTTAGKTDLGSDCDPGFQARLDAFVAATCPCEQPATTTAPPIPAPPPATTTEPAAPTPPATPPPVTTTTATITVVVTTSDPIVDDRLTALEDALTALKSRVGNLEAATDAAWLAYRDAIDKGATPQEAADIARGTALNLIYGLGVFA